MPVATRAPFGAVPLDRGVVGFRVWAPRARSVAVELDGDEHELREADDGVWEGELAAEPGDDYRFVLDGREAWPDPARAGSRRACAGLRGSSTPAGSRSPSRRSCGSRSSSLYELHVGTFSAEGTFDGVLPRLSALRELGVTAIELMPVATFPGERGWGYDGLYTSAPHPRLRRAGRPRAAGRRARTARDSA